MVVDSGFFCCVNPRIGSRLTPLQNPFMKRLTCLLALLALPSFAADIGVRIRFGLSDTGNTVWDGSVAVSPGAVEKLDGWRFEQSDAVVDATHWKASTRTLTARRTNNAKKKAQAKQKGNGLMA